MYLEFAEWSGIEQTPYAMEVLQRDWRMVPLVVGGEIRAVAAVNGSEIHFAVAPNWRHRTITKRRTIEFLRPLFNEIGFLTTRALRADADHRFLSRLGFEKTRSDGFFDFYMMTALPFGGH